MEDTTFDEFLDDATHAVADVWEEAGGKPLNFDAKIELNDLLTGFFQSRR